MRIGVRDAGFSGGWRIIGWLLVMAALFWIIVFPNMANRDPLWELVIFGGLLAMFTGVHVNIPPISLRLDTLKHSSVKYYYTFHYRPQPCAMRCENSLPLSRREILRSFFRYAYYSILGHTLFLMIIQAIIYLPILPIIARVSRYTTPTDSIYSNVDYVWDGTITLIIALSVASFVNVYWTLLGGRFYAQRYRFVRNYCFIDLTNDAMLISTCHGYRPVINQIYIENISHIKPVRVDLAKRYAAWVFWRYRRAFSDLGCDLASSPSSFWAVYLTQPITFGYYGDNDRLRTAEVSRIIISLENPIDFQSQLAMLRTREPTYDVEPYRDV